MAKEWSLPARQREGNTKQTDVQFVAKTAAPVLAVIELTEII